MDWPDNIPLPQTNLAGKAGTVVARTEMDSGRVRQRDRFGVSLETYNAKWLFLGSEFEAFKAFFADDITNGLDWFNLPFPGEDGSGDLVTKVVRIVGAVYSKVYVPVNQWEVSLSLEVQVAQSIPDPELDIMPLLRQDVIEVTENMTLSMANQNKFFCVIVPEGETITITLPVNAGFTSVFSCGFTKEGLGEVIFAGQPGVVVDSPEGALRIFRTNTPVTVTYRAANRFKVMGSLY